MTDKSFTHVWHPILSGIFCVLAMILSLPASAASSEIEELKAMLQQQQKQIEQLQQQISGQKQSQLALETKVENQTATAGKLPGMAGVQIYGIIDGGMERITNVGANHESLTRLPSITGTVASRLGIKAEKEVTPGYKAIATLETGFNSDTATLGQGGRIFGRQLFAGFATPYGDFTFGRQYSLLLYGMFNSDLLGPNIYSLGSFDPYLPNARFDNTLQWRNKLSNISVGINYALGRDTAGSTPASGTCAGEVPGTFQTCAAWSAFASYDGGFFGLATAIDEQHGGAGATVSFFNGTAPMAFVNASDTDRRTAVGGFFKIGSGKVGIGWLGRKVETAAVTIKSNAYYVEGAYNLSDKITFDGGIHRIINNDQDRDATLVAVRGFYNFDKDISAYLQLSRIMNSSKAAYTLSSGPGVSPLAGNDQNGYMLGMRYKF